MNPETKLRNACFAEVGALDGVLTWQQVSATVRAYSDPTIVFKVGEPGMADLGLIVGVKITPEMVGQTIGVAVQVELKMPKNGKSKKQLDWEAATTNSGGVYEVIRSPGDLVNLIERVKKTGK
jgi:hypothetical protein